jgi:hypothetical protein
MRRLTFKEPNFKCKVKDQAGNEEFRFEYADSETELRDRLERLGFDILSIEPYQFSTWKTKAQAKANAVLLSKKNGEQYEFDSGIWGELKQYLFALAADKCAYCEGRPLAVSSGDVEHYRPKKKVEEDDKHEGYYWLAYEVENYLPSCEKCNRARGKMNHFPIGKKGKRATKPTDDLSKEKALLLNPFLTDPTPHLKFITGDDQKQFGIVVGATEIGEVSVTVYNLNRHPLVEERRQVVRDLRTSLSTSFFYPGYREKLLNDLRAGARAYSSILMATFNDWWEEQKAKVDQELNK